MHDEKKLELRKSFKYKNIRFVNINYKFFCIVMLFKYIPTIIIFFFDIFYNYRNSSFDDVLGSKSQLLAQLN